jgi:subtilase family serine protease
MKNLVDPVDRSIGVSLSEDAAARRRNKTVLFAVVSSLISTAHCVAAQPERVIDLSPMVAQSTPISRVDPGQEISVVLSLPLGDPNGAAAFIERLSDRHDSMYGHYLTPQEFAASYGANEADYAGLKDWAIANGLRISQESVARTSLTVSGSVAQFEKIFQTQLNNYRSPDGQLFYSASVQPVVPDTIAPKVLAVIGLTDSIRHGSLEKVGRIFGDNLPAPDTGGGTGPNGYYGPADLRTAYTIPRFGGKVPQTIALFEEGGFLLPFIKKYVSRFGLREPPITLVPVNGYGGAVNQSIGEVTLDIDAVIGINPDLKQVLVYADGKDQEEVAVIDALEQIAADNQAQTLSISYGTSEALVNPADIVTINSKLMQLAGEGITVCVSAGDYGAYGPIGAQQRPATLNVTYLGAQPYVTCVGGTTLYTGVKEAWQGEEVWNDFAYIKKKGGWFGASGGGISSVWSLPTWQPASYVTPNGGSSTNRNIPDVGAVANPMTGLAIYNKSNGGWVQAGGTSLSSPLWAAYLSILNSGLEYLTGTKIGFFNPALYALGNGNPVNYLHDITEVSNGNPAVFETPGYYAGTGYDNCSGSGSIKGADFAFEFLSSETGGTPPGPINGLTVEARTKSVNLSWDAATLARGYVFVVFNASGGQAFITKDTKYTVNGLGAQTTYTLNLAAVNSGGSTKISPVQFTTQ